MTSAETILSDLSTQLEGMVDESSLRKLVERSQGPVYACERQAGGYDRASRVTALLLDALSREIPESKMIDNAILTVRTSDELPLLIREMAEIDQGIRTVISDDARKFLFLQFEGEAVEDCAALSLLYWLKDRA